jgi:hypothetical protein
VAKDNQDRSARAKAAQMREAERKQAQRKRLLLAGGVVLTVLAVLVVLVVVSLNGNDSSSTPAASGSGSPTQTASAQIVKDISSVPQSTFDAIGAGTAAAFPSKANPPGTPTTPPRILYVGAEFCPFCAAERWPTAVALARFGSWNGLGITTSSATDQPASVPTLTFHGATLTSSTVTFKGYETTTNQPLPGGGGYEPLDSLSGADQQIVSAHNPDGTIPFISFDEQYLQSGASYSPAVLEGKTQEQIAAALADPQSPIAQAIVGSANVLTAAICATTKQQPADVCTSSGVKAGAAKLGS